MYIKGLLTFAICSWLLQISGALDRLTVEKEILDKILSDEKNNIFVRPPGRNGTIEPVIVKTNMYVRSINKIDDMDMEYQIQLTFRQQWHDSRLAFDTKDSGLRYVPLLNIEKVWTPDVFFSNEKEGHFHNIVRPNILMRIYPNGDILFSTRISLKLSCPMDLRNYPLDHQICPVILASYGYTTDDLIFLWKEDSPVQWSSQLNLPNFKFTNFDTNYCTSKTSTGEYSCLKLNISFSRELGYFLYQVYMPFASLVILSWIPFWLNSHETTARVSIWVSVLLVMAIISSTVQSKLPNLSVTKAIDVWMGVCGTFLFAVIIEFVVISQINAREEKTPPLAVIDNDTETNARQDSKLGKVGKWLNKYPSRVKRIDVISRVCFPLAFIVFNIIYWATYVRSG